MGEMLFGGGTLLYHSYLSPRLNLSGSLLYRNETGNPHPGEKPAEKNNLDQTAKREAVISFGAES